MYTGALEGKPFHHLVQTGCTSLKTGNTVILLKRLQDDPLFPPEQQLSDLVRLQDLQLQRVELQLERTLRRSRHEEQHRAGQLDDRFHRVHPQGNKFNHFMISGN